MENQYKITGIRFPTETHKKLKEIAKKDRRTFTETVLIACDEFIEKNKSKTEGEVMKQH